MKKKRNRKKRIILNTVIIVMAVAATGTGSYFSYKFIQDQSEAKNTAIPIQEEHKEKLNEETNPTAEEDEKVEETEEDPIDIIATLFNPQPLSEDEEEELYTEILGYLQPVQTATVEETDTKTAIFQPIEIPKLEDIEVPEKLVTSAESVRGMVEDAAKEFDIEPSWIYAVIDVESGFNQNATNINRNGTIDKGLMQINSGTAPWIATRLDVTYREDIEYNPATNIRMGAFYLNHVRQQHPDNLHYMFTSYNRGQNGAKSLAASTGSYQSSYSKKVFEKLPVYQSISEQFAQNQPPSTPTPKVSDLSEEDVAALLKELGIDLSLIKKDETDEEAKKEKTDEPEAGDTESNADLVIPGNFDTTKEDVSETPDKTQGEPTEKEKLKEKTVDEKDEDAKTEPTEDKGPTEQQETEQSEQGNPQ